MTMMMMMMNIECSVTAGRDELLTDFRLISGFNIVVG